VNVLLVLGVIAVGSAAALGISFRRRKSAAERERERRLKVNTVGRICDGVIERLTEAGDAAAPLRMLYYSYSVGGVGYSAAQDITLLLEHIRLESCTEGFPAGVKYDPQNPSNSIVVCELWSGLR
jgi:hypothetical protein